MRSADALRRAARERFRRSTEAPLAFFDGNSAAIAAACRDVARAFHHGGRLFATGPGAAWSDALHVSVEFVHPVIVGKRALPAHALSAAGAAALPALVSPGDIALGITHGRAPARTDVDTAADASAPLRETLAAARHAGLLTVALTGPSPARWPVDHHFAVPVDDPVAVQEVQETCYHVIWELVHVFLDQPGSLQ